MLETTVLLTVQQVMAEMGLPKPSEAVLSSDATVQQVVALMNRCGTELVLGYPWEELTKEWVFDLVDKQSGYVLPSDWNYFIDQTQWDRTNHWPLLGPKTAQEWQWLKGGLLSSGPRTRYRIFGGKLELWPVPAASTDGKMEQQLAMEYVSLDWVKNANVVNTTYPVVKNDSDIILIDSWVLSAYMKLKFWEAKGLDTTAYAKDFVGTWESRIGKNKGAPMLTLAPRARTMLIGINNIPDGSWNIGGGTSV